jgi:ABC-type dipeptide/oligopeptide/nickel transport system permease subunit
LSNEEQAKLDSEQSAGAEPVLHLAPELAVAEDLHPEDTEFVAGTSLWKDAWRRLLKNKLAVFGLIVVATITIGSLIGPPIIKASTGYTYDSMPRDVLLLKAMPPFADRDGSFSWRHPMGTDNSAVTSWRACFSAARSL